MKKIILAITCASFISSVNSFGVANAHYHDYHGHHDMNINTQTNRLNFDPLINNEIVDSMHMPMMNEEFVQSGNVDKDFIANMIPHHQGAIDSAKLILEYGSNEEVKAIARNIIKTQTKEIEDFNELLANGDFSNSNLSEKAYAEFVAKEKENMAEIRFRRCHGPYFFCRKPVQKRPQILPQRRSAECERQNKAPGVSSAMRSCAGWTGEKCTYKDLLSKG